MYSIVEEHYGNIQVESPVSDAGQGGTCIRLKLPAYEIEDDAQERSGIVD